MGPARSDDRPPFEVAIHDRVHKRLRSIHPKHQHQIISRIADLEREPRPQDSISLRNDPGFRITIGEYRILYDIDYDARLVQVRLLMHRGEGYNRHLR